MTESELEEQAFNDALDAHPEDHTTRLVYADWLDEHGDPRAAGYRAMGRLGVRALEDEHHPKWHIHWNTDANWILGRRGMLTEYGGRPYPQPVNIIPESWIAHVDGATMGAHTYYIKSTQTRREMEDKVALAFSRINFDAIPPDLRAELLTPACPAASD